MNINIVTFNAKLLSSLVPDTWVSWHEKLNVVIYGSRKRQHENILLVISDEQKSIGGIYLFNVWKILKRRKCLEIIHEHLLEISAFEVTGQKLLLEILYSFIP